MEVSKNVNQPEPDVNAAELAASTGIAFLHIREELDGLIRAINKTLDDEALDHFNKLYRICAASMATTHDLGRYIDERLARCAKILSDMNDDTIDNSTDKEGSAV